MKTFDSFLVALAKIGASIVLGAVALTTASIFVWMAADVWGLV